jgi:glycosyltransferase involved in cell wall biosynthesis
LKKQLLIAYSFPPIPNAESIVTVNMVNAMEQWNWQSVICTVKPTNNPAGIDATLSDFIPASSEIHRTIKYPVGKLSHLLNRLKLSLFADLLGSFPDESIFWYPTAKRLVNRILNIGTCQVIHSRSAPQVGNFLGLYAKKKSGLPWIAHFSDPWVDNPYNQIRWPTIVKLHHHWEKQIIKYADIISFTNQEACQLVMAKYPKKWIEKCCVIPHGYKIMPPNNFKCHSFEEKNLNILYLGSFYGKRNPLNLFEALRQMRQDCLDLSSLKIWLIGRMPHETYKGIIKEYNINDIVYLKKAISHRKALLYARAADVLLTLDTECDNSDIFLESKLIEYFGFAKPIWGIVTPNGKSDKLLKSAGCLTANMHNPQDIADNLEQLKRLWSKKELPTLNNEKSPLKEYKIENTTKKLAQIFDKLI